VLVSSWRNRVCGNRRSANRPFTKQSTTGTIRMSATRATPIPRQCLPLVLLLALLLIGLDLAADPAEAQAPKLPTQGPGPAAQPSTTQAPTTPAKKIVRRTPINWKLWGGIAGGAVVAIILIV